MAEGRKSQSSGPGKSSGKGLAKGLGKSKAKSGGSRSAARSKARDMSVLSVGKSGGADAWSISVGGGRSPRFVLGLSGDPTVVRDGIATLDASGAVQAGLSVVEDRIPTEVVEDSPDFLRIMFRGDKLSGMLSFNRRLGLSSFEPLPKVAAESGLSTDPTNSGLHGHPHDQDGHHAHDGLPAGGGHEHTATWGAHVHRPGDPAEGFHLNSGPGVHDHPLAKGLRLWVEWAVDQHYPSHKWLPGHRRTMIRHIGFEDEPRPDRRGDWWDHVLWENHSAGFASPEAHGRIFLAPETRIIRKVYEFEDGASREPTAEDFAAEYEWFRANTPPALAKRLSEAMAFEFTDRYDALGIEPPDPETVCRGHCEGSGIIPVKGGPSKDGGIECALETDPVLLDLWRKAEDERVSGDGWHFVKCPECGGTGKSGHLSASAGQGMSRSEAKAVAKTDPNRLARGRYRMFRHWRGKSAHLDLRHVADGGLLEGWTIADQPAGAVAADVESVEDGYEQQARVAWKFGPGMDPSSGVVSVPKERHPLEWFNAFDVVIGPGEVGASSEEEGVITLVDDGELSRGMAKPDFMELFLDGNVHKGRLVFRRAPTAGPDGSGGRSPQWLAATNLDDGVPTILGTRERRKPRGEQYVPAEGEAAIPEKPTPGVDVHTGMVRPEHRWWADGTSPSERLDRLDAAFDDLAGRGILKARKLPESERVAD